ncbi:MAG: hypothetical protein K6E72_05275 [Saccharofermentans sp.]|nr:hypothetical protein [Saccharofermentans sp.]
MKKFTKETGTNEELAANFDELQKQYCGFSIERIYEWEKDTLAALRYAKDNFADLIDFDKGIGAAGLSFGGATSYALCEDEPEFVCGINMDGGLFGKHEGKILKTPFLHINCETNRNVERIDPSFKARLSRGHKGYAAHGLFGHEAYNYHEDTDGRTGCGYRP